MISRALLRYAQYQGIELLFFGWCPCIFCYIVTE